MTQITTTKIDGYAVQGVVAAIQATKLFGFAVNAPSPTRQTTNKIVAYAVENTATRKRPIVFCAT